MHFPVALEYVDPEDSYPSGWHTLDGKVRQSRASIQETWQAMEHLVDIGLVKSISVSNFQGSLLIDLLRYARIRPALLQVEIHPYLVQEELVELAHSEGIVVTAYSSCVLIFALEICLLMLNTIVILVSARSPSLSCIGRRLSNALGSLITQSLRRLHPSTTRPQRRFFSAGRRNAVSPSSPKRTTLRAPSRILYQALLIFSPKNYRLFLT